MSTPVRPAPGASRPAKPAPDASRPAKPAPDASRPAKPAPDASMDLLNAIIRQPIDPDYAKVAARADPPDRHPWAVGVVAVLIGAIVAVAALQTSRAAPALESERSELIDRVQQAETDQDALRARVTGLTGEIAQLRATALGNDSSARALQQRINTLEPVVGTTAVTGPGVVVVVDDAPAAQDDARDRVLDIDLQILANGLWAGGAEAVAINGHRLTSLTAIRSAGDAITVDYRSLTRPYRVEAVGDTRTLPARLTESAAGAWWNELAQNRSMPYQLTTERDLTLPADPGMGLRYARAAQR